MRTELPARQQAELELAAEQWRASVDAYKVRYRQRRWWHRLFPFVITITRRPS